MTTATGSRLMTPVSRENPCPICHKPDWCLVADDDDAAICARVESSNRRGDAGWLHRLTASPPSHSRRPVEAKPAARRADDVDLDRVYRALLNQLSLRGLHQKQLRDRGLTDADIKHAGYRSLQIKGRAAAAGPLQMSFSDELLLTVPGIVVREGQYGRYLSLAGFAGLLIPVRDAAGQVVGCMIRPDESRNGAKYLWLTSKKNGGPSPGARVHVPVGVRPSHRVVLTEGALKSDVAHAISGHAIVGLPGPHVTREAIGISKALDAREVLLALDADACTNPAVALAQVTGLRKLKAAGFIEGLVRWDGAMGKGIDDAFRTIVQEGKTRDEAYVNG